MVDFFVALLNALGLMDSAAQTNGPPTWSRRHRTLIRVLYILCMIPACAVLLILLVGWVSDLSPLAQKVVIGVGAVQLVGLLVLLGRRGRRIDPTAEDTPPDR
jgi:hypothetical protein